MTSGDSSIRELNLDSLYLFLLILIGLLIAAPFAFSAVRRIQRRRRRRMVNAPRRIPIAAEALEGRATCADGEHVRDADRVRPDGRNGYNTVCRRCGVAMNRPRKGEWRVTEPASD